MPLVNTTQDDHGIATLWLNDPARRNAMSEAMGREFAAAVQQLKRDVSLRALVVTGAGSAFSAGGDLNMLREKLEHDAETNRQAMLSFYDSFLCILQLPIPLIAAINGHAMGAGMCLALACDFRVISTDAKFGFNFVRLGLHPGMGATYLLPRIVGTNVALDWLLTGRTLPATSAGSSGLFHEMVEPRDVLPAAYRVANSILPCGPRAVRETVQTLRPLPADLNRALAHEAERQSVNYAGDEFRQYLTAALSRVAGA